MKIFNLFLLSFFLIPFAFSQAPEIEWQNTIGGYRNDFLYAMDNTSDGGIIVGGNSFSNVSGDKNENAFGKGDYWIVKFDIGGSIEWQKTIGGSEYESLSSIMQTSDGGYLVSGHSGSPVSGNKTAPLKGEDDYWVIKLNATGLIEWQATYGGNSDEFLSSAIETSDDGYLLVGSSWSGISGDKTIQDCYPSEDCWIVKIDAFGEIIWQNSFGGTGGDRILYSEQTNDSGFILGGMSSSPASGDKSEDSYAGSYDYWVLKLNSLGNIEWQNTINGEDNDYLYSIHQVSDGGFILGGSSNSEVGLDKTAICMGEFDYWVLKLNDVGEIVWQKTFGGVEPDYLTSITNTSSDNYLLAGYSWSDISGNKTEVNKGEIDVWLVLLNYDGEIIWQLDIGGSDEDHLFASTQCLDEAFALGSYSVSGISGDKTEPGEGHLDYWIIKLENIFTCIPPAGIFSDNITSTTAAIHWNLVPGAVKYQINYRPITGGAWLKKNSTMTFKNLTGLMPNTTYEYKIKTICTDEASGFSPLFNFTTLPLKAGEINDQFIIYPNPSSENIIVTISSTILTTHHSPLTITDLSGKNIAQLNITSPETEIDISNYPSGIYFVKMMIGGEIFLQKLIKD